MAYEERPEREEQKRLMEERTRQLKERVRSQAYRDKERIRKVGKLRDGVFILTIVLVFIAAILFYLHNYRFQTYQVNEETEVTGLTNGEVYQFKNGVLLFGTDSLSFLQDGVIKWTTPFNVQNPIVTISKDYFSVYDKGSYYIYICDETGVISNIKVSRMVYKTDLSESGVSAVLTESEDASYISYFDRFGNRLSVEVKTLLNATGFPLDISVSPDGQCLSVVYYSTVNGIGESRLVVYDFSKGKSENSYVVFSDDSSYLSNTFLVESRFLDDTHLVSVGDNKLLFLDRDNGSFSVKEVEEKEPIVSVFSDQEYFGIVKEKNGKRVTEIYDKVGKITAEFDAPLSYNMIRTSKDDIVFVDGADLYLYNTAGRLRYEGTFPEVLSEVLLLERHKLYVYFGQTVQKITLK